MTNRSNQELQELCFQQKVAAASKPISITRGYYWWKLHRNFARAFKKHVRDSGLVVDIGTGHGAMIQIAYGCLGPDFTYWATDLSESNLALAEAVFQKLGIPVRTEVTDASVNLPLEDNTAAVVVCSEVIEHIPEPEGLLREAWRILKPGGIAVFSTPNASNPMPRISRRDEESDSVEETERWSPGYGHVSVLGRREWQEHFKKTGFEILQISRGALLLGKSRYDKSPFVVALYFLFDAVLDFFPATTGWTENLCFTLRKADPG
jgi:SAM-dependent methyltransferase